MNITQWPYLDIARAVTGAAALAYVIYLNRAERRPKRVARVSLFSHAVY